MFQNIKEKFRANMFLNEKIDAIKNQRLGKLRLGLLDNKEQKQTYNWKELIRDLF
jgi:hypothetical protein